MKIGTCSWKFPEWRWIYGESGEEKGFNHLEHYSQFYSAVEIDQWFWSLFRDDHAVLPDPVTVAGYLASVDPEFRFAIKAPNSLTLTHFYPRYTRGELRANPHFLQMGLMEAFVERISPMLPQTDAIMFQFEYLNRKKVAGAGEFRAALGSFLAECRSRWPELPLAVECRNGKWLDRGWFTMLRERSTGPVFTQGYFLPPVREVVDRNGLSAESCADPVVFRLMGPDRADIERRSGRKWDRRLNDRSDELAEIAALAELFASGGRSVSIYVNNHFEGAAPLTIATFQRIFGRILTRTAILT